MEAVIEGLEISEKLRFRLNGKVYVIATSGYDDFFNGTKISTAELDELKKLPSHIRDHLLAKFVFKAKILDVQAEKQIKLL